MRKVVLALLAAPVALGAVVAGSAGASSPASASTTVHGLSRPLAAVSCVSATFCAAVGQSAAWTSDSVAPVAEVWTGKAWKYAPTRLPSGTTGGQLDAVACTAADSCLAVGSADTAVTTGTTVPFVEKWNGKGWTAGKLPLPAGARYATLAGLACWSAAGCVAVGSAGPDPYPASQWPLAAYWNGRDWTDAVLGVFSFGTLNGVACPAAKSCVAAGSNETGAGAPVIARWNGTKWSASTPPMPAATSDGTLNAVACKTAAHCIAVGQLTASGAAGTLAETWNGTRWRAVRPPAAGAYALLNGVSCGSTAFCVMGGTYGAADGYGTADGATWSGTKWATAKLPVPPGGADGAEAGSQLNGVSCVSASDCVAVGAVDTTAGANGFAERWTGKKWELAPIA